MKFFPITTKVESRKRQSAFTMMEIAISLAVIGIALVGILAILPAGLQTQRENREKTLINQDVAVFMEMIRNGVRTNAPDADLTNYVFAITNYQTFYNPNPGTVITNAFNIAGLTNNYRIVGVLSTPQFTDGSGRPIPALLTNLPGGCYSNHIVAYVRSISGLALEKPPQANPLLHDNSFGYRLFCENVPTAFLFPTNWQGQIYNSGDRVWTNIDGEITYWRARVDVNDSTNPPDAPSSFSSAWVHDGYAQTMANSTHELRLTFFWPLLPNSGLPPMPAHQTYRTLVTGQLILDATTIAGTNLYFFKPQTFTNAP